MDGRRYYALDALRGVMMMLGIILHASVFYLERPPLPVPGDASTSVVFDAIVLFIHSFRMPLFFVLAGFFTSLLVEKYAIGGSLANRGKRILAPFLLGLVTIVPVTAWIALSILVSTQTGERQLVTSAAQLALVDFAPLEAAGLRRDPSPVHLWFLYFLLWFYLLIPLLTAVNRLLDGSALDARLHALVGSLAALPLLGAWTAFTLTPFPGGLVFEGYIYFVPDPKALLYYGSFFVSGWFFHRWRAVLEFFRTRLALTASGAAILFPIGALLGTLALSPLAPPWLHPIAVVANGLATWFLIYAITGIFLRFLDTPSPWSLYISQSSYWVYLVHMPIVSLSAWWLLPFELSAVTKFTLDVAFTSLVCFASYHYLIRRSWVSVLLCGKRFDLEWPWRSAQLPPVASAGLAPPRAALRRGT